MGRKCSVAIWVLALTLLGGSGACFAQETYDIAAYMPWKAGQWTLFKEYDPLDSSCGQCYLNEEEHGGIKVSKKNGSTIQSYYHDEGQAGNWILGHQIKYTKNTDKIRMTAIKNIMDGKWWNLKPVPAIPRLLKLNEPVYWNGKAVNGTNQIPLGIVVIISKAGFSVTTPAGSFPDCIQSEWIVYRGSESASIETKVMAKGVGEVKVWTVGLGRAARGFAAQAFGTDTEYHEAVSKGVSSPPFP